MAFIGGAFLLVSASSSLNAHDMRRVRIMLETEKPRIIHYTKKSGLIGATMIGVTSLTARDLLSVELHGRHRRTSDDSLIFIDLLLAMLIAVVIASARA